MRPFRMAVLVTLLAAAPSHDAAGQALVCETIRPGDTASEVAQRLTGSAGNRHRAWFQVVDARWRPVARSRYHRVNAGWRACVPAARALRPVPRAQAASAVRHAAPADAPLAATAPPIGIPAGLVSTAAAHAAAPAHIGVPVPRDRAFGIVYICLAAAAFGAVIGFLWRAVDRFMTERRVVVREMQVFGEVFVRDFERPLVGARAGERPIRARVRCAPWYRRLEILLAPADGRRYPNLDDHRRNVEYDVDRITERLRHHPFVRKPLRREGRWVVIPFQFHPGPKTGAFV